MEYMAVPNHEDRKGSEQLSHDAEQLLELLDKIADERDTVRRNLNYVHDLIDSMESQLTGYDTLISQALSSLMQITEILEELACSPVSSPVTDISTDLAWIDDTWLCSSTSSTALREAEISWLTGHPQNALDTASSILTNNTSLDWDESMKFRLLMAAILLSTGVHHESSYIVDNVLRRCDEHFVSHHVQATELSGVASFIKGKHMMIQQNWKAAYQAFANALQTPGYQAKAQKYQREAVLITSTLSSFDRQPQSRPRNMADILGVDPLLSDPVSSNFSDDEHGVPGVNSADHTRSIGTPATSTSGGDEHHAAIGSASPSLSSGEEDGNADHSTPGEPWHSGSTDPISREDFHRYQTLVEEQMNRLRLERDEFRVLWNYEKARADSGLKRYRETQRILEQESKRDYAKWERSLRSTMNEPVWPPPGNVLRSQFLYDNVEDIMMQHCITTTLLHAQACVNAKDLDKAEGLAREALKLAKTFDYEPIEGRCIYWLGRVEYARENHKRARMFFMKARSCIGKYKEGEDVELYLSLFRPGLSDLEKKRIILRHAEAMHAQVTEMSNRLLQRDEEDLKADNCNSGAASEPDLLSSDDNGQREH
ncbi:hypothetical protein PVAR5_0337 [Paecilomyces variotii No. 5]|uniref:Uncharacterized protein n=1 Tax=Byssochlamys spectabilis (strain No. 5 / NBRC 109023) TaxID=1356009 RepID=V5FJ34_BYSSN|nr:hypothetical protein PVAR5_0337 [Paecilomyces variotii No. 5]